MDCKTHSAAINFSSGLSYSLPKECAAAIKFISMLSCLAISKNEMDVCFAKRQMFYLSQKLLTKTEAGNVQRMEVWSTV